MDQNYIIFNKALKTFIRELIVTFPKHKEFSVMLMVYKMCKSISRKTPLKYFKEILLTPYRDYLIREDDAFFNNNLFTKSIFPIHIQILLQDLDEICKIWSQIDEENKKIIWQHIKILIVASDNCDKQ